MKSNRYSLNKITPAKIIIIISIFLFLSGSTSAIDKSAQPYLLLYAFDTEGELLAEKMEISVTDTILGRAVHSGRLSGIRIVLAESGVGMTNAAMTTQKLIDKFNPKGIIFSGIAGGIDSSVHIGDIVICDCWITHDYTYHGSEGMIPNDIDVYSPDDNKIVEKMEFFVDSAFLAKASELNETDIGFNKIGGRTPEIIFGGNCVSGNSFIDNVEKRLWLSERFDALTVDMESSAVVQVAFVNGLPFIIFRSASDLAGGSGSATARAEINQFFGVAAVNSAQVVMKFLEIIK